MSIDWSKLRTAETLKAEAVAQKQQQVRLEATRRIESKWDKHGQANVALGMYTPSAQKDCRDWIAAHIAAAEVLLVDENLLTIDITSDTYWP